jgi:glycosyltransferase involved in cell wall biosynthesis
VRVLISAYACEPGRGSESEVGWQWVLAAARLGHEVTVITRSNNREKIEARAQDWRDLPIRFHYHEAPAPFVLLKRRVTLPRLYYLVWQASLVPQIRRFLRDEAFDRYHQLTYVSARFPSVLAAAKDRFVWGPVGGLGRIPPDLRRELGPRERLQECVRDVFVLLDRLSPLWWRTARNCRRLVVADVDTMKRLPRSVQRKALLAPAIGIDITLDRPESEVSSSPRVVLVGELVARKGQSLGLRALARIKEIQWVCEVIGEGPDKHRLEALARKLGIAERVVFKGNLPRQHVLQNLEDRPVFVSLSLRESGGMALLEAAAAGCPLVFLDTGGPSQIFGRAGFGAVAPGKPENVVVAAATEIERLLSNKQHRAAAGREARAVAERMAWETKNQYIAWLYGPADSDGIRDPVRDSEVTT